MESSKSENEERGEKANGVIKKVTCGKEDGTDGKKFETRFFGANGLLEKIEAGESKKNGNNDFTCGATSAYVPR